MLHFNVWNKCSKLVKIAQFFYGQKIKNSKIGTFQPFSLYNSFHFRWIDLKILASCSIQFFLSRTYPLDIFQKFWVFLILGLPGKISHIKTFIVHWWCADAARELPWNSKRRASPLNGNYFKSTHFCWNFPGAPPLTHS